MTDFALSDASLVGSPVDAPAGTLQRARLYNPAGTAILDFALTESSAGVYTVTGSAGALADNEALPYLYEVREVTSQNDAAFTASTTIRIAKSPYAYLIGGGWSDNVPTSVVVAPVISRTSGGDPTNEFSLSLSQGSAPELSFACTDAAGEPIDLSAKVIRFVVGLFNTRLYTPVFTRSTGDGVTVSGDDDNIVKVQITTANTAADGKYAAWLWNITNNLVLAKGTFTVLPARKT